MVLFANLSTHGKFLHGFWKVSGRICCVIGVGFVCYFLCLRVVFVLFSHCVVERSLQVSVIADLCYSHWFFSDVRWPNCEYHAD